MAMPSASEVQAALAAYNASAKLQSEAKDDYDDEQGQVTPLRPVVDKLIRDIWDHIEFTFRAESGPAAAAKAGSGESPTSAGPAKSPTRKTAPESRSLASLPGPWRRRRNISRDLFNPGATTMKGLFSRREDCGQHIG